MIERQYKRLMPSVIFRSVLKHSLEFLLDLVVQLHLLSEVPAVVLLFFLTPVAVKGLRIGL